MHNGGIQDVATATAIITCVPLSLEIANIAAKPPINANNTSKKVGLEKLINSSVSIEYGLIK